MKVFCASNLKDAPFYILLGPRAEGRGVDIWMNVYFALRGWKGLKVEG